MNIPEQFQGSIALHFIQSRGWDWKVTTLPNIELEKCPYCNKGDYGHFYMELHGASDELKRRDGLHQCQRCGKSGNLYALKEHLGVVSAGMDSRKEWASGEKEIEPLPDVDACHQALLEDEEALDYLVNGRGFSLDIIKQQKLGLVQKRFFREVGDVRALVYPYLVNGNCIFVHYRTLPSMEHPGKVPKAFNSPKGWDVPLYNGEILRPGLKEVVLVEGEANAIAALDKGITNICGVPGANVKKAEWIDTLDKLELDRIYICYDSDKVGQRAAQTIASRIGVDKCWRLTLPAFTLPEGDGVRAGKDLNEWFVHGAGSAAAFEKLKDAADLFDVDGVSSTRDALDSLYEQLLGHGVEPQYKAGPWPSLCKHVGYNDGDVIDILAPEKIGKGGRASTPVLTSSGWKPMGELQVGDELVSVDGAPSFVTGVYPRGEMDFYRVTFSDGRQTDTTADHLWKVRCTTEWQTAAERIYTTDAVAGEFCYAGSRRKSKLYIPLISGHFGSTADLPVDPWLLGALIGDGSCSGRQVMLHNADPELVDRAAAIAEQYHAKLVHTAKCSYRFNNSCSMLLPRLIDLGLHGCVANIKFIPTMYLSASREQRWELLRGLMDTDGTASNKHGVISYCTVSKQLANDVVYLVRSLGGIAEARTPKTKHFRYKGELRTGQPAYNIIIRLPERQQAFTLTRKLDRVKPRQHQPRLTFKSIDYAGKDQAVCIAVSHPSKLYITDDFIVTHNTTFGMNLMEYQVNTTGQDGIIICLEMMREQLARKWVCHKRRIADNIPKSPEEAKALTELFLREIPLAKVEAANREGDLYWCLPRYRTCDDLYQLIVDCIRRYGVRWVMLDNIQRMADTTPRGNRSRTEHLSEISKRLSQIAKEYNIQMIRILQPHRIAPGQMVSSNNVDGSSQIAKDCDCMITLHRNPVGEMSQEQFNATSYVEATTSFDERMKVTVALSRYSSGGYTTLHYDGAKSTVLEYEEAEQEKMMAAATKNVGYDAQKQALGLPTSRMSSATPNIASTAQEQVII